MIDIRGVDFRYPDSSKYVLRGLSLQVPDHGITAIMGANGSGKSTTALCMNGILIPEAGEIRMNGLSPQDPRSREAVRRAVGVVFQNPNSQFTSLTVERELAFGLENTGIQRHEMKERVGECLRLFDLDHCRTIPPSSLSGGEKQKVALAAVAIMNPLYLVLDEATSLLAPMARRTILRYITLVADRNRSAIVLITQFPQEAMLADELMIFREGQVEEKGPPSELFRNGGKLKRLGIPVPLSTRLGLNAT